MVHEHETIWMWAEYGDALFWNQEGGCIGDSHSLITDWRHKKVDLSRIEGLAEWYARFDNDAHPAYEWTPEEYDSWFEEGWKYARAVRRILPDEIDLKYAHDDDGNPYPVPRESRVQATHPVTSTDRLVCEATHFILSSYNRTLDPAPYLAFIEALCQACPCEELISQAHCWWSREKKELRIQWYHESLDCYITFGLRIYGGKETWCSDWSISDKWSPNQKEMPVIGGIASSFIFDGSTLDADYFFTLLSWLIIDRGLK